MKMENISIFISDRIGNEFWINNVIYKKNKDFMYTSGFVYSRTINEFNISEFIWKNVTPRQRLGIDPLLPF